MKVILLDNVSKIGKKYQVKEVSSGYARNFLIPRKLGLVATKEVLARYETLSTKEDTKRQAEVSAITEALAKIPKETIHMSGKANEKGHLFAGIHKEQVVEELNKVTGLTIARDSVECEESIKTTGKHEIAVLLGDERKELVLLVEEAKEAKEE
jgi:large subunit ribosomal protein L9